MTLLAAYVSSLESPRVATRAIGPSRTSVSWKSGNAPKPGFTSAELDPRLTSARSVAPTLATLPFTVFVVPVRSEEHTSELQSRRDLVCRLLLEKKKKKKQQRNTK